jgi:hypothetical protein
MELKSSNWRDIQKYYDGTFVKINPFVDQLFCITSVSEQAVKGLCNKGQDEFILHLHDDAPYSIDFVLPHKAMFQFGKKALLLYRVPARQYSRGICPENTRILDFIRGEQAEVSWSTLTAYVEKPAYLSLKEAISSKNSSCALNPRMALDRVNRRLFVDSTCVGTFSENYKHLQVIPALMEEAQQLVAQDPFLLEISHG